MDWLPLTRASAGPANARGARCGRGRPPPGGRTPGGVGGPFWAARSELARNHALLAGLAAERTSDLSPADGQDEADRATAMLRPLVVEGYRNQKMSIDPDFDPLRGRPEFPLLMMDLVMPAEPFADRR